MKVLSIHEQSVITGGEILPGWPADGVVCTDVKLMVNAYRNEPGFDVSAAVRALLKQCNADFWTPDMAREYVMNGGVPVSVTP